MDPQKAHDMRKVGHFIDVDRFSVTLANGLKIRWCLVCYLLPWWDKNILVDPLVSQEFAERVAGYLSAFAFEKKMPPPEIATTIMNMADDLHKGRNIELRAGDYIALNTYFRSMTK